MSSSAKERQQAERLSRRAERRIQERQAARRRRLLYMGSAVGIAIIIAVALILANRDGGGSSNVPPVKAAAVAIDPAIPRDGRVLGDPTAPVLLIEWGDYQCPACGFAALNFTPRLIDEYVKTGKVRFEFRDFPFLDGAFARAAQQGKDLTSAKGESIRAAEAAADQGKFWEFHEALFSNQHGENQGAFSDERLKEIAKSIGLDMEAFNAAFDGRAHIAEIVAMYEEATRIGISSTPSYVINGKVFQVGSYDDLKQRIEAALAGQS
ncbi:MAG: disulfide bond formation protein DsbA [Chloroflexota bacterium]